MNPVQPSVSSLLTLKIELGALVECPVWEAHSRGKNWCARIWKDPKAPNGLGRDFWEKARGEFFYLVPSSVSPGQVLEFGADYYSGSGRRSANRQWYLVTEVSPDQLTLQKYESASEAIAAARKFIPPEGEIELAQNQDQIQALEAIRDLVRQHQISLEDLTRFLAS